MKSFLPGIDCPIHGLRDRPTCECCWLEWAVAHPPKDSGLTWACAGCMEACWPYHGLAEAVNKGGRSGVL